MEIIEELKKKLYHPKHFHKLLILTLVLIIAGFLFANYMFYQNSQKSKASVDTKVSLSFEPASGNTPLTTVVKATLLEAAAINVTGYKFKIAFDKSKAQVTSLTYNFGTVTVGYGDEGTADGLVKINDQGYILVRGESQSAGGQTLTSTATPVVTVSFSATAGVASTASLDTTNSFFNRMNSSGTIESTPVEGANSLSLNGGGSSSSTSSSSSSSGGSSSSASSSSSSGGGSSSSSSSSSAGGTTTSVNMKLKFQGILSEPSNKTMQVKVTAVAGYGTTYPSAATFTAQGAIWSGAVTFPNPRVGENTNFYMLVKGPKHVQKKICDEEPAEDSVGAYSCQNGEITLESGMTLDFSGITLMAGDLPTQDGIVDSYDLSLVRNNLNKTDEDILNVADVNLNGRVDAQDYSLIIQTLSIRPDDQ